MWEPFSERRLGKSGLDFLFAWRPLRLSESILFFPARCGERALPSAKKKDENQILLVLILNFG